MYHRTMHRVSVNRDQQHMLYEYRRPVEEHKMWCLRRKEGDEPR